MLRPWGLLLAALAAGVLGWLLVAALRNHVPGVAEIRARAMDYDALVRRLRTVKRIEKPEAYAAALYRRAYGRNPPAGQ